MLRITVQSLKIVSIVMVGVLILAGARLGFDYALGETADPDVGEPIAFTVTADDSAETVADRLADDELIQSTFFFTNRIRFAGNLLPGDYTLERGMSVPEIIDAITEQGEDDVAESSTSGSDDETPTQVTIIENQRIEQTAQNYADAGLEGGYDGFMEAAALDYSDNFPFLADRPEGATLEGYLFPATYTITPGTDPQQAVFAMLQTFDERFTQDLRDRAAEMGLTIYQVLTIASIVEREAVDPAERPIIAAVYLNRVEAGMTLGADPTVQYVVGTPANWWPVIEPDQQYSTEADSPYNTYINQGIPPGPICSPSIDSIVAVLRPADVDYLYFVATNDGSTHVFATTLEEQNANIEFYLNGNGAPAPTAIPPG